MLSEPDHLLLGSVARPTNSVVCSCRSVLVSEEFIYGIEVLSFWATPLSQAFSASVHESYVTSTLDVHYLTTLVRRLIEMVFWIPSWSISSYVGPTDMPWFSLMRRRRSIECS